MPKCYTAKDFIDKSEEKFQRKYDYSKVNFIDMHTSVCIICPKHGEFWQTPHIHLLSVHGCPQCAREETTKKKTDNFNKFISQLQDKGLYNEDYTYHKTTYTKKHAKMLITCKKHGIFFKSPKNLLLGCGCPQCKTENKSIKNSYPYAFFIKKATEKFKNKFQYNEKSYKNFTTPMEIFCEKHGWFKIKPNDFLSSKYGCPQCGIHQHLTLEEIADKSREFNGDKYEYIDYDVKKNMITLKCKKHNHVFKQTTFSHIKRKHQCPICSKNTSVLEKSLKSFFQEKEILFEEQKKFDWLRYKHKLSLDFYLPQYNIAIECQGIQHFENKSWSKNEEQQEKDHKIIKERDKCKRKLCEEHDIKLLYYSNLGIEYPYNVFEDKDELLKEIQKNE